MRQADLPGRREERIPRSSALLPSPSLLASDLIRRARGEGLENADAGEHLRAEQGEVGVGDMPHAGAMLSADANELSRPGPAEQPTWDRSSAAGVALAPAAPGRRGHRE